MDISQNYISEYSLNAFKQFISSKNRRQTKIKNTTDTNHVSVVKMWSGCYALHGL